MTQLLVNKVDEFWNVEDRKARNNAMVSYSQLYPSLFLSGELAIEQRGGIELVVDKSVDVMKVFVFGTIAVVVFIAGPLFPWQDDLYLIVL